MFRFNNQTNPPNQQGGLFSNMTNTNNTNTTSSLFGNTTNQPQGKGLFGNNTNNNQPNLFGNNSNTNNTNNPTSLFGNNQSNTGNLFGNTSNSNTTTNNNQKFNFGAPATNNPNTGTSPLSGIFQNNNTNTSTNPPTNNINSNQSLFGQQNTLQNAPNIDQTKNKTDNTFSLFSNDNQKTLEKPLTNDTNNQSQTKPQNSLFSNIQSGNSLFGAPKQEEKKSNETTNIFNNKPTQVQPQTQTQTQTQTQNKEIQEKKAEEKPSNSLFGTNINNQSGAGNNNNLFGNILNNKPEEKKVDNNNTALNAPNTNNININLNQNVPKQNQPKKENSNNEINNINNNMNIKIPEKPFDVSLSNAKELEEFEKNQMLYKTNGEILEEFKKILFNQQAKYKQCVQNTRKLEKKLMGLIEINETNAIISKHSEKKGQKIIDKINTINYLSKNLENIITNFNDKLNENLIPFKDNIMNSDKFLLNENNSEKFKFYENFEQISDKCYLIENAVNEAEQNFFKKEKEIGDKNKNENDGIWIEKNNKKIFINQNEMNNLFSECYDGLANLRNMQDNIDKQYEMLKSKLIKSNKNNYNLNYNMNNIY